MFLKGEFSNRLVQVSLFAGIVYYITAYPVVFESARKYFPIKFKKTHHLLIFHTFLFAVLMYVLTYFVFDPLVKVVEGADIDEGTDNPNQEDQGKWYYFDKILQQSDETDKFSRLSGETESFKEINCEKIKKVCTTPENCELPPSIFFDQTAKIDWMCDQGNFPNYSLDAKNKLLNICSCFHKGVNYKHLRNLNN